MRVVWQVFARRFGWRLAEYHSETWALETIGFCQITALLQGTFLKTESLEEFSDMPSFFFRYPYLDENVVNFLAQFHFMSNWIIVFITDWVKKYYFELWPLTWV